ncbi:DUF4981 domain-containing protein [Streptomyces sp. NPDC096198]|uniref:DUF4981 domain-containing protein n=1 Tax=Streptomyces sp. NPDC096198 TaxID=3366080 RepID=UPI003809555F
MSDVGADGRGDDGGAVLVLRGPGYEGASGGGREDGAPLLRDGTVRVPGPAGSARREDADPVRMRCYRHEGIVLRNHQRRRGLDWLTAEWELSLADGRTLRAPAELPRLVPGESAAVGLPFALPGWGGEAWLTLRVRTARDEPGAPRGTEVCGPRIRLRGPAPEAAVPAPDRPTSGGPRLVGQGVRAYDVPGARGPGPCGQGQGQGKAERRAGRPGALADRPGRGAAAGRPAAV